MSDKPVALVTGASRGIGAATAIELAGRGYRLAITAASDQLASVATELERLGTPTFAVSGDLADLRFAESLIDGCVSRFGRIDLLVNNAAWRELLTMREITVESWEKTLRVCLTAPAFLSRWAAKEMERRRAGVIVNISSMMSSLAGGYAPAYIAAKGALDALTYELAALYGPAGIRVVAVNPGAIDAGLSADYGSGDAADIGRRIRRWSEEMIPLGRWGQAQEVAKTIAFVASPEASYITGTTLTVDGGWSHQYQPYSLKKALKPDQFP